MSNEVKHTAAADLAEFEEMTVPAKLRAIWLNGKETNGHVAEAFKQIEAIRETQATVKEALERTEAVAMEGKAIAAFIKKWGAWGTAAVLFVLAVGDRVRLWDVIAEKVGG